jgi:16S rRNA (guanine1516-N2)-methyltransferase
VHSPLRDSDVQVALAVLAATARDQASAAELARQLDLPLLPPGLDPAQCDQSATVLLVRGPGRSLQRTGKGAPGPVAADFHSAGMRYRLASGAPELLGRAVGLGRKSRLRVLDSTAGLGRDAFVLAGLGCEVLLCERDAVIAELLRSGLAIASHSGDVSLSEVAQRMRLYPGDARNLDALRLADVDVICLDPMFPARSKSAAVKKEMALFHDLLRNACEPRDADALLQWALRQDVARVVVKRPGKAPPLAQHSPSHSIRGKAVRYDVYVLRGI